MDDSWQYCSNKGCINHKGEGISQERADFTEYGVHDGTLMKEFDRLDEIDVPHFLLGPLTNYKLVNYYQRGGTVEYSEGVDTVTMAITQNGGQFKKCSTLTMDGMWPRYLTIRAAFGYPKNMREGSTVKLNSEMYGMCVGTVGTLTFTSKSKGSVVVHFVDEGLECSVSNDMLDIVEY